MRSVSSLFARLDALSLRAKLLGGFSAVILVLTGAIGAAALLHEVAIAPAQEEMNRSARVVELALLGARALANARRYEKDFLLRYPEIGFNEASSRYITLLEMQLGTLLEGQQALRSMLGAGRDHLDSVDISSAARRYGAGVARAVEMHGLLGGPNSGLEGDMRRHAEAIDAGLGRGGAQPLRVLLSEMRRQEQAHVRRPLQRSVRAFREANDAFRAQLAIARPGDAAAAGLERHAAAYRALFERYVWLRDRIEAMEDSYRTAVGEVEPLLDGLVARVQEVQAHAYRRAARIETYVKLGVLLATLLAFATAGTVAAAIRRNLERTVEDCVTFAGRIADEQLDSRLPPQPTREFGVLANALNHMADTLQARLSALAKARARLEHLVRVSPAVIYAARAHGDYGATYISPNVREQLGHAAEDFLGDPGFWANNIHPEDRERVLAEQARLFTEGRIVVEHRFRHKDGSWRWMYDTTALVRDAAGAPLELVGSWIDITRRKEAEMARDRLNAALARSNRALQRLDRMKSEFLASVTHELRTPLNAVIGFAELLKAGAQGPLNAAQAESAADIHAAGLHLLAMVDGMLELARLGAGTAASEQRAVEVGAALEECVAAHRESAAARRIQVRLEVAGGAGGARLDARALRNMLDALIDNAIKFNREGGSVTVRARRDGDALEIAVADSGIGIAAADLPRLFKPFSQLEGTLARRYGGTGLGLALVKRIAELLGGSVAVESRPGAGSTFTLRLPAGESRLREAA